MDKLENQPCPFCRNKTLTLTEGEIEIPYFGKTFVFGMNCSSCKYNKSDVEAAEQKDPCRYTLETSGEEDMKIRVVKSSEASIKIPTLKMEVKPGPDSEGYVSNIEGVLDRFKKIIEEQRDLSEEEDVKKNAKNLLKKLWKIKLGDIPIKIVIEDPSGNSAIISQKAKMEKLKV
ncbi:ZPR1 zinc finger domain-containing protein [Candidatus Woesearchaeota archaeon]|nr:ZPR1 zinc finger domain-containing protein [Candidatus Woesearchaeota archaeon]